MEWDRGFKIERFELRHVPGALAVERLIFDPPWSEASFRESLQPRFRNWAVLRDEQLIGYLITQWLLGEVYIFNVGVAPDWQRQGIAAKLIGDLIAEAEAAGMREMLLEVRVSNEPALHLYRKYGFTQLLRRRKYYPNGEDAFVMHRRLGGTPEPSPDQKEE
ncbi:ribosomal protein S18-alanine N-acetyltransferase [candidate division KSB1 bacterium]|nr:ribosomal protein S18-alanine N-acetyltransferase [candidate division KSB1 bacterium]